MVYSWQSLARGCEAGPRRREDGGSGGRGPGLDADRARFGSRLLPWLRAMTMSGEPQPLRSSLTGVSGRVRLARSDVDRVSGTGVACGRAGD